MIWIQRRLPGHCSGGSGACGAVVPGRPSAQRSCSARSLEGNCASYFFTSACRMS